MRIESYVCDSCKTQKQDGNHWFVARITQVGIHIHTWAWAVREEQMDDDGVKGVSVLHLCGEQCVSKAVSEWLASQAARWV